MLRYPLSIVPGIVSSLISFLLLLMVTISTPLWNAIYFLELLTGPDEPEAFPSNSEIRFGVFGSTYGINQVGYDPADWPGTGVRDPTVDQSGLNGITYALVLHPVAAFLAAVTFGFMMTGLCSRSGAVFATISSALMTVVVVTVFIVDAVLFGVLKSNFVRAPYDSRKTSFGPALWIALAALFTSLTSLASATYTSLSHNRYPRKWANEKEY